MLHYVGYLSPTELAALTTSPSTSPPDRAFEELRLALNARGPGVHRVLLEKGLLSLTLCVGDGATFLADHKLFAQTIWWNPSGVPWSKWTAKALARLCARGAQLQALLPADAPEGWLREAGFVDIQPLSSGEPASCGVTARFDPPWPLGSKEPPSPPGAGAPPASCCVVGAGISGASVAYALARRGWQVTVLDRAPHAAAGASGLPVGLVVPHISADDSPRSRLSRVGARLMLQHTAQLLTAGTDWAASGVLEHRFREGPDRMHQHAGWVKPAALVKAWLQHPDITVRYSAEVSTLRRQNAQWAVLSADGGVLAVADHVVLATAFATPHLLQHKDLQDHQAATLHRTLGDLQAVHGTATTGAMPAGVLPPQWAYPHNGMGCMIPAVPGARGEYWLAGSSFEPDGQPSEARLAQHRLAPLTDQHRANWERLHTLWPEAADVLRPAFEAGAVEHWSGTRCVTHDRLPLAGPVDSAAANGLWMHVGMGARGLTFSALGAELIAARMAHEPWPVETSLAKSIDAQRLRKRRAVREVESDST
jgi:tRNA 5-methylaminomethyl-2-thiouridine biosynthesis bifunctional protein